MSCAIGCEAGRGRATARGRSRPRSPRDRVVGEPSRSRHLATRLAPALRRGFPGDDAIDPLLAGLLGHKVEAEFLAHHPGEEAADRMLLPTGRLYDGRNGCPLRPSEQFNDLVLLRVRVSFSRSRLAGSSLRLARSRFARPLRGLFSLLGGLLLRSGGAGPNGLQALVGDLKPDRSLLLITPPDREARGSQDLFQHLGAQQLVDDLLAAVLQVVGYLQGTVIALTGAGQENELCIGELHGILLRLRAPDGAVTAEAPRWRASQRGRIPERSHAASSSRATLPLCSHRNASPFRIILLLIAGPADHGMIRGHDKQNPVSRLGGRPARPPARLPAGIAWPTLP